MRRRVAVIGGGIAGLSAALRLAEAGVEVTLLEATTRLGGKLWTVDEREAGAENFLMRDPAGGPSAAVDLAQELGLGDDIVHPVGLPAGLYLGGELRPLPTGTMLGIPGPTTDLTGVATLARGDVDTGKPVLSEGIDVAVGQLVRGRLGDEVVSNLVDPLLGGVYAGRADQLSLAVTMPALHRLLQTEHTLVGAVARVTGGSKAHSGGGPIFGTVKGGLSRLVDAAAKRLVDVGADIRLGATVRDLSEVDDFDGVVLAVPGGKARRLLPLLPPLEYASVGLVTFELPAVELPALSGFLVPEGQGVEIKAATFFSQKWEHVAGFRVRASLGRAGAAEVLQRPDDELIRVAHRDLSVVLGELPEPHLARVDRWGGGLPQYPPNHGERVKAAREALTGSKVVLAGAAYDGVGIPACVKSGRVAAETLVQKWSA